MTSAEPCGVRRHQLERLEVGELAGDEATRLRAHAAGCARCAGRLEALAAERRAFAASTDPVAESVRILAASGAPASAAGGGSSGAVSRWLRWAAGLAVPVAAALVVWWPGAAPLEGVRTKGGGPASLAMFVNRPEGPQLSEVGVALRAGDQIQFRYSAAGRRYVYVVSVDGRRAITALHPSDGGPSVPVAPSGDHVLPGSIILDDALGPERVYAFFSDAPLDFTQVQAALTRALEGGGEDVRALDRVEWEGVDQASVWFVKVP